MTPVGLKPTKSTKSIREIYREKGNPRLNEEIIDIKLRRLKNKGINIRSNKKRYPMEEAEEILKIVEEAKAKKNIVVKIKYPGQRCSYVSETGQLCQRFAIGKGTLCYRHGGMVDKENLLTNEEIEKTNSISKASIYNPAFHPMEYLRLCKEGMLDVEAAAEMGISVRTLQTWMDTYADFAEAYEIGQSLIEAWWLKVGREAMERPRSFNTPLYKFLISNKLGYSEKSESKNTTQVNYGVLVVPGQQSMVEWEQGKLPAPPIKEINPEERNLLA